MNRDILQNIIEDFSIEKFKLFFCRKNNKIRYPDEPIGYFVKDDNLVDGRKFGGQGRVEKQGWKR